MEASIKEATIRATGENIKVYLLNRCTYYDYDNMFEHQPPSASKAGKKEFNKKELIFNN